MPDEAAFYGPKIDVKLVDAIGRPWQLSTVQFDFTLPRRFGLEYIAEDGKAHQPLMVHRALYGSVERFFGILIEHYAGAFPVWLAPVQAIVLPITDRQHRIRRSRCTSSSKTPACASQLDDRSEKVNLKIREAQLQKIPYMLVVGDREAAERAKSRCATASTATRASQTVDEFLAEHPRADRDQSAGPSRCSRSRWRLAALVAGSLVYCVLVVIAARSYLNQPNPPPRAAASRSAS